MQKVLIPAMKLIAMKSGNFNFIGVTEYSLII